MMKHSTTSIDLRFVLFAFIVFGTSIANADEVTHLLVGGAEFTSLNGLARVVLGASLNTFSVWLSGNEIYKAVKENPSFKAGRFFIANSGNHVVWMLNGLFHSETILKGSRGAAKNPRKEQQKNESGGSPNALIFFERGKEIKAYTLRELLVRDHLISSSASHTQWIMSYRNSDWSPASKQGAQLVANGSLFELETTSFRTYSFDMKTGNLTYSADSDVYTKADAIVFGKVHANSTRLVRISSVQVIKDKHGDLRGLTEIKADDSTKTLRDSQTYTIVLNKKGEHWEVVEPRWHFDVSYNNA